MSQVQKGTYADNSTISNNIFLEHQVKLADVTGARIVTGGLEISVQRLHNFVQVHLKPSAALFAAAAAAATAYIIVVNGVPVGFRPSGLVRVTVAIISNNIPSVGEVIIQTDGSILYSLVGAVTFTSTQLAAVIGDACFCYDRTLATF